MTELSKLQAIIPNAEPALLEMLWEDAQAFVRQMANRSEVSGFGPGIRAVAAILYGKLGREGLSAYSAGGVSVSYQELPAAVRGMLPKPLVCVAGRRFEYVESKPGTEPEGDPTPAVF